MRNLVIFGLVVLLVALNCEAMAPAQLSGTSGKDVLTKIASKEITTQPTNAVPGDLWSWGSIPYGNMLVNGKLVSTGHDGNTIVSYPAFPVNTTPIYQIANPMTLKFGANDLKNPDFNGDLWSMAQLANQPVLY
jgi:hypothetical protein